MCLTTPSPCLRSVCNTLGYRCKGYLNSTSTKLFKEPFHKMPSVKFWVILFWPECGRMIHLHANDVSVPMMTSSNGNIFRVTGPFVRGIHRSPVNFHHKGQWRGALMFSLICAWTNDWTKYREAGDLRRHSGHYDAIVMSMYKFDRRTASHQYKMNNIWQTSIYWWNI